MDTWFILLLSISLFFCVALRFLFTKRRSKLPPGPPGLPIFGNVLQLRKSLLKVENLLRKQHEKYGPIITVYVGRRPTIFIASHSLAYQALIQKGSFFSDRPPVNEAMKIISSKQHNINTSSYGPLWRLLRRNLKSEILHPSRIKSFMQGRKWVLKILVENLRSGAEKGKPICVIDSFQHAIFCLLLLMCFGQKLDDGLVKEIKTVQQSLLITVFGFSIFSLLPKFGKIVFRKRWNDLLSIRRRQEELFIPLIRARRQQKEREQSDGSFLYSYVDSLLTLQLPNEGGRELTEGEMVSLCSEFLNAGTDTTSTMLQWIMASLVKNQRVQAKLLEEIKQVTGEKGEDIQEEELQKMPYLKAVIMEVLRKHPPAHFVLPHSVSAEVMLEGYVIPKNATVNFMVGVMGLDRQVWEDPMEFRPERFLEGEEVDITGSREIKMMPFGAGRRICPGLDLAMLHLEYFVANLVKEFEWKVKDGEEVDMAEKQEFTVVMKNPLLACIAERMK